jgi:hypothetical protein
MLLSWNDRKEMAMKKALVLLALLPVLLIGQIGIPSPASAYDARDYIAAPPGTNLVLWYYQHTTGQNFYANGEKVSKDNSLRQDVGIFRYVHFMDFFGITIDPQILVPFGSASAKFAENSGGPEFSTSGLADVIFACTFWLVNKPQDKMWFGFTQYIYAPTGEYSNNKPLNLGNNRWMFKEEIGFNKGFGNGWYIDVGGSIEIPTDNTDYTTSGLTLKQDPSYTAEVHLSKDINKNLYLAGEYFYKYTGETEVNGLKQNDQGSSHAAQLTAGYNFTPQYQLLVQYRNDFKVENGFTSQTYGFRFLYAF